METSSATYDVSVAIEGLVASAFSREYGLTGWYTPRSAVTRRTIILGMAVND
jgi:hypothetical protein